VDYGKNPRFSKALNEICENLVGRTMFKVLMTKMILRHKTMRICEHHSLLHGSSYKDNAVYINLSFYNASGTGIADRQYYYVDKGNQIKTKLKSLAGSVFHEFCHGLHDIGGTTKPDNIYIFCASDELRRIWSEDKELCTIACCNSDPICDHCFDFYQSILNKCLFYPRYAHKSWTGGEDSVLRSNLLRYLPQSQKYMDGWKEYIVD
jgi:hypothetical protein